MVVMGTGCAARLEMPREETPPLLNTLSAEERQAGWRLLWDGHSAAGWRSVHADHFPAHGWVMEQGVLTVLPRSRGGRPGGDIITRERFSEFELELEFKLTRGANSGVKYFAQPGLAPVTGEGTRTNRGPTLGLEYQILDDAHHPDARAGRDGNRTLASLYDLLPPSPGKPVRPVGHWNSARIVVRGRQVEHWLNGEKVLTYERGGELFRAAVARSKFRDVPGFGEWPDGHILLQDHGSQVSFRNLKIRVPPR